MGEKLDITEMKKIRRRVTGLLLGMTALLILYMVYVFVSKNQNMISFKFIIAAWVICYVILMDILEPVWLRQFDDITIEQRNAFAKFFLIDAVGMGALVYFVFSLGESGSWGMLSAVIYFISIKSKTKFKNIFLGKDVHLNNDDNKNDPDVVKEISDDSGEFIESGHRVEGAQELEDGELMVNGKKSNRDNHKFSDQNSGNNCN